MPLFQRSGWELPVPLEEALTLGVTHYVLVSPHTL